MKNLTKPILIAIPLILLFMPFTASANGTVVNGVPVYSGHSGPGMTGSFGNTLRIYNNTIYNINCTVILNNAQVTTGVMIPNQFTDIMGVSRGLYDWSCWYL